jgi:hypothetical protein
MNYKKRPPSYSEGYITEILFDKVNLNEPILDTEEENIIKQEVIKKTDYFEIIYVKIVGFMFHLVLIASFELVFFNFYIIQYENNALISLTDQLISPIILSCNSLPNLSKILVDDFLQLFINQTTINQNALDGLNQRNIVNHFLFIKSIYYYVGVIAVFFGTLLLNYKFKKNIDFRIIAIDNIIMIIILGVYEYIFFKNIIFPYQMISPNELIQNIVNNLINTC